MNLSVALCTYNGERFLSEQLASILRQNRLPDELVICDDASTDRSVEIATQFAERAPFPVRVEVNSRNMGSTPNFARAIELCTGDAIVLSDQDDVWLPNKLSTLEVALLVNPEAGFVFSNAEIVDERLDTLGYTLWEAINFKESEQESFQQGRAFEKLLRRHRVTGATMAFRSAYRKLILPIPGEWYHDAWIALILSSIAPCCLVSQSLIRYRQHSQQQFGGKKRGLYGQFLSARTRDRQTFEDVAHSFSLVGERLDQLP